MEYRINLQFIIYNLNSILNASILNLKNLGLNINFKFQTSNLFWGAHVLQN